MEEQNGKHLIKTSLHTIHPFKVYLRNVHPEIYFPLFLMRTKTMTVNTVNFAHNIFSVWKKFSLVVEIKVYQTKSANAFQFFLVKIGDFILYYPTRTSSELLEIFSSDLPQIFLLNLFLQPNVSNVNYEACEY